MPRIGGALPKVPAFRPQRGPMLLGRVKNKSMVMEYAPAANAVVWPDIDLTPAPSARFYGRISCLPSVVKEPPFYLDVRALLRARVIAEVREGALELERIISGAKDALNVVHRSNDGAGRGCSASKSDWWPLSVIEIQIRSRHHGAAGPALRYQSRICSPVQNSTSCLLQIVSKMRRKYLARCGAPMM
jgi:hypothetical protein